MVILLETAVNNYEIGDVAESYLHSASFTNIQCYGLHVDMVTEPTVRARSCLLLTSFQFRGSMGGRPRLESAARCSGTVLANHPLQRQFIRRQLSMILTQTSHPVRLSSRTMGQNLVSHLGAPDPVVVGNCAWADPGGKAHMMMILARGP